MALRLGLLLLAAMFASTIAGAQCGGSAAIGTSLRSYIDPARGNRAVGVRIDYPALKAGTGVCALPVPLELEST